MQKKNVEIDNGKKKKILIIGRKIPSLEVTSYDWFNIPEKLNLADYHVVIFDIHIMQRKDIIFKEFDRIMDKNYWNLLFSSNSKIYIFGSPEYIKISDAEYYSRKSPIDFLIGGPNWSDDEGEVIRNIKQEYLEYFKNIKRWYFHFQNQYSKPDNYLIEKISQTIGVQIKDIKIKMESLAENNYGKRYCQMLCMRNHTLRQNLYAASSFNSPSVKILPSRTRGISL